MWVSMHTFFSVISADSCIWYFPMLILKIMIPLLVALLISFQYIYKWQNISVCKLQVLKRFFSNYDDTQAGYTWSSESTYNQCPAHAPPTVQN